MGIEKAADASSCSSCTPDEDTDTTGIGHEEEPGVMSVRSAIFLPCLTASRLGSTRVVMLSVFDAAKDRYNWNEGQRKNEESFLVASFRLCVVRGQHRVHAGGSTP